MKAYKRLEKIREAHNNIPLRKVNQNKGQYKTRFTAFSFKSLKFKRQRRFSSRDRKRSNLISVDKLDSMTQTKSEFQFNQTPKQHGKKPDTF